MRLRRDDWTFILQVFLPIIAAALIVAVSMFSQRPAPKPNDCIVIDLRTKPGAGKLIPAEPGAT